MTRAILVSLLSLAAISASAAPMECYGTAAAAARAIDGINFPSLSRETVSFEDVSQGRTSAEIEVTVGGGEGTRTYSVTLAKARGAQLPIGGGSIRSEVDCTVESISVR